MSEYLSRLDHFRFGRDGGTLVVTSSRSPGFERTFQWKEEYESMERDDLQSRFYDEYYMQLKRAYREYQNG